MASSTVTVKPASMAPAFTPHNRGLTFYLSVKAPTEEMGFKLNYRWETDWVRKM